MSKELAKSARKRFGQNFLIDGRIIDAILASINASASDAVVEIGPGHGAITEGLYASQCDLTLIELDRDLVPGLLASFVSKSPERCRLLNEDVLKVDFTQLSSPLRIVGNLPYNISTPLLFKLLELGNQIQDIHVMLQKEVVNRIAAAPGESAYGRLGVMIQATARVEPLIDVPPESFAPAPKVDSGIIRIIPDAHKRAFIESMDALTQIVRQAFSQRRKTLRNNLKDIISLDEFEALGINPQDRPERLSVETYVELGNYLGRREGEGVMQDLRYQVDVNAQATYIEAQSNPSDGRFVFTYTVTIANNGTLPAQLLHRYWKITDGEGGIREVHGDGVVGEQPTIVPGDEFTYTSGAILETAVGTMEGYFEMVSADGEIFKAKIPVFTLLNPGALH